MAQATRENLSYLFDDPMGHDVPDMMRSWTLNARRVSDGSHDTTKVGAIILNHHFEPIAVGCNNFAPGEREDFTDRKRKNERIVNAEEGAMNACLASGIPMKGCTMVTTHFPSVREARMARHFGIREFFVDHAGFSDRFVGNWRSNLVTARDICQQAGIRISGMPLTVQVRPQDIPQTGLIIPEENFRTGYAVRRLPDLTR